MEVLRVREKIYQRFDRPAVALGNFDGVHLGHQKILKSAVETAHSRKRQALVYTFDPHPRVVLNKAPEVPRITTLNERAEILEHLGIDVLIMAEFTLEFAAQSPQEFVKNILVEELGVRDIFVGEDYRFGKGRLGTAETLRRMAPEEGFRVHVVPAVMVGRERVSSSRIREHLTVGDIGDANRLLGRQFAMEGKVIHGHHRGKTIGFPTANIKHESKLLPPEGVYAGYCRVRSEIHPAVMNIGRNPTFKDRRLSYEVHILDFDADIYGEHIRVYLVEKLRPEMVFSGIDELKAQILRDIERSRGILALFPNSW